MTHEKFHSEKGILYLINKLGQLVIEWLESIIEIWKTYY